MFKSVDGVMRWNYDYIRSLNELSDINNSIHYVTNAQGTMSVMYITDARYSRYNLDGERLLLKSRLHKPIQREDHAWADDDCRCCGIVYSKIPIYTTEGWQIWDENDDNYSYDNGILLHLCTNCVEQSQDYLIDNNIVISNRGDFKYMVNVNTKYYYIFERVITSCNLIVISDASNINLQNKGCNICDICKLSIVPHTFVNNHCAQCTRENNMRWYLNTYLMHYLLIAHIDILRDIQQQFRYYLALL